MGLSNPEAYTFYERYYDLKKYLTRRNTLFNEESFNALTQFNNTIKDYKDYKMIFGIKRLPFSKYKSIKRKIFRKKYTFEQYINDSKVHFPLSRQEFAEVEGDLIDGLREMFLEGKKIVFPFGLDVLQIVKKHTNYNRKIPDWKTSLENKQKLIEQGKKPALSLGYTFTKAPIFEEGSEKWIVYLNRPYYPLIHIFKPFKLITLESYTGKKRTYRRLFINNGDLYNFTLAKDVIRDVRIKLKKGELNIDNFPISYHNNGGQYYYPKE